MNYIKVFSVLVIILGLTIACQAAPAWYDLLLGNQPTDYSNNGYGYGYDTSNRQPKNLNGKERYKKLCRVLNPDPYANPGSIPYPAAPLCPY